MHVTRDESGALARLAAQIDRIERDVNALRVLRADVTQHGEALRRLSDAVARQAEGRGRRGRDARRDGAVDPDGGEPVAVPEWMTVTDPALAVRWLSELAGWVTRVWSRYQELPECWPWHPSVVAELLACRRCWLAAVGSDAQP